MPDEVVEEVLGVLRRLEGVVEAFVIKPETRRHLREIEQGIKMTLGIEVRNTGIEECLKREHLVGIIKNRSFRAPPEPTVLLMGDDGTILGEEVLPERRRVFEGRDDVIFLSEDFVIYTDRRAGKREYFLMPPISFPEVEAVRGTRNVVSSSPTALGDVLVRKSHGYEDDPRLATVIIGFDTK